MAKTDTSDPFTSTDFSTPDSSSIIPGGVSTGYETTPIIQDMERPKLTKVTTNEKTDLDEAYSSLERAMRLRQRADQLKRKQRLAQSFPTIQSYADLTKSIQGYDDLPYREKDKIYQQYMDGVSKMLDDYNEGRTVRTGKIDKNKFLEAFQTANPAPDKPDRTFMELLGDIGVRLASGVVTTPAALSTMIDVATGEAQSDTTKALYDQVKQLNDAQSAKAKDTAKELEFDKMMLQNDNTRSAVSKFFGEIGLTLTHMSPESIAELAGNILPSVGLQTLVGTTARAVSARIIAKQALEKVGKKSLALGTAAAGKLSAKAAADVAARAGKIAGTTSLGFAAALNTIMSGGDAANTAYEHVMGMTNKELRELPDYAEKYAQYNGDEKAIRDSYARDGMQVAAAIGSVVGLGGALSPLSMERGIGRAVAGRGGAILSSLAGAVTGAFEEGATQVAGNIGGRYAGADVNLMEGVAEAATQGLIGEGMGTMGGALAARMGRRRMTRGLNEAFTVPEVTAPGEQLSPIQQAIQQRSREAYAIQAELTNPDVQLGENARNQLQARYERLVREAERLQQQHRMSDNPGEEAPIDFARERQQDTQTEYQELAKEMEFMLKDPNSNLTEAERTAVSRGLSDVNAALEQMANGNFDAAQAGKIESIIRAEEVLAEKAKPNTEGKRLIAQYEQRINELQERAQAGDLQAAVKMQTYQTRLEDLYSRHRDNPNFIPNPEDALPSSAQEGITEHENLIKRIDERLAKLDKNSNEAIQLERAKSDAQNFIQELQTRVEYDENTDKLPSVLEAEKILAKKEPNKALDLIEQYQKKVNELQAKIAAGDDSVKNEHKRYQARLEQLQNMYANNPNFTPDASFELPTPKQDGITEHRNIIRRIDQHLAELPSNSKEAKALRKAKTDAEEFIRKLERRKSDEYKKSEKYRSVIEAEALMRNLETPEITSRINEYKKIVDDIDKTLNDSKLKITPFERTRLERARTDAVDRLNKLSKNRNKTTSGAWESNPNLAKPIESIETGKRVLRQIENRGVEGTSNPQSIDSMIAENQRNLSEAQAANNAEAVRQIQATLDSLNRVKANISNEAPTSLVTERAGFKQQIDSLNKFARSIQDTLTENTQQLTADQKAILNQAIKDIRNTVETLEKQKKGKDTKPTFEPTVSMQEAERIINSNGEPPSTLADQIAQQRKTIKTLEDAVNTITDPSIKEGLQSHLDAQRQILNDLEAQNPAEAIAEETPKAKAEETPKTEKTPKAKTEETPKAKQTKETPKAEQTQTEPKVKQSSQAELEEGMLKPYRNKEGSLDIEKINKRLAETDSPYDSYAKRERALLERIVAEQTKETPKAEETKTPKAKVQETVDFRKVAQEQAKAGGNMSAVLDAAMTEATPEQKKGLQAFKNVFEKNNIGLEMPKVTYGGRNSSYDLETHTINLNKSAGVNTVLHEMAHAMTARGLRALEVEAMGDGKRAKAARDKLALYQALVDKVVKADKKKSLYKGIRERGLVEALAEILDPKFINIAQNLNVGTLPETVSYTTTTGEIIEGNPNDALGRKIPPTRKVWQAVINWIKNLGNRIAGRTTFTDQTIHEALTNFANELAPKSAADLNVQNALSKLGVQAVNEADANNITKEPISVIDDSGIRNAALMISDSPTETPDFLEGITQKIDRGDESVTITFGNPIEAAIYRAAAKEPSPSDPQHDIWSAALRYAEGITSWNQDYINWYGEALKAQALTYPISADGTIHIDNTNKGVLLGPLLETPQAKQNAEVNSWTQTSENNSLTFNGPENNRTQEYVNTQIENNQSVEGVEPKLTEVARTQGQKGVMNWIKNTFGKAAESAYEHFGDAAIKQRRWLENIGDMRPELNPIAQRVDDAFYAVEGRTDHYANLMYGHGNQAVNAVNELARTMKADPKKIAQDVGWYMTAKFAPEAQARLMRQMEQQIAAARVACLKDPDNASLQKVRDSLLDTYFKTQQEMDGEVNAKLTMPLAGGMNTATANNIVNILESRYGKDKLDSVTKHIYDMNAMRLAVAIETGQTLPKTATEFLEKPQLLQQLEDHAALARNPQVDERTLRKSRKEVMDAVRSEYVPLTGDPTASLDIDEMTAPGNGRRNPNTPADKRMGGRVTVANNGWDASLESAQKTAKFGGWKPYADRVADLHAAMTESERQEAGFGRKELTRQDLTPQSSIVIRDLTRNRAYAYSMPDEVMTAVKQANTEQVSAVLKPLAWATHKLGYGWTQLRVQFAPINMWKDVWERGVNLKARFPELEGLQGAIWKNVIDPELFKATYNFATGRENNGSLASLRLAEMDRFGALITKSNYFALSKQGNLAELKSANPVRRMLKGMERGIHIYNQTFDLISSLSTYMALVEKGITPERAAAAVLDTMNFRKKGSWMPNLKAMFPFIQPGVTSGIQLLGSLYNARTGKINMTGMVQFAGYTLLFLALRQMARMAMGDDKGGNKIDQLSEYEKLHNVLLPLGDRVLPIPITFGLPLATNTVANGIIDGVSGNKKLSEVGINIAKDAIVPAFGPEVNNIDPTQDFSAWLLTQLSPAGVEPFVRIATNKDSLGRDIINKKSIKADVFMSEQGRVTTAPFFHSLARWLRSTGFVDPAPEQVREGWNSIMLGNLKELSQALITNPHLEEAGYETKTPMSMWHNLRGNITQQAINFSKMTDKIKAKQATGEKLDSDEKKMLTLWENYDKMDSARRKLIADVKKENISDVAKAKRIQRINKSYENRTADYVGRARSIWN